MSFDERKDLPLNLYLNFVLFVFSLISNITQLENQLSEAELNFHRQTNDLRVSMRQLQEENEQQKRKINELLL